jgi:chemotaxis protein CheD
MALRKQYKHQDGKKPSNQNSDLMNITLNKTDIQACESRISDDSRDVLFTRLEGPNTAVVFYDAAARIGGLLHYLFPSVKTDAGVQPYQFADTGIEKTLFSMIDAGAEWDRMIIKICGAAMSEKNTPQDTLSKRNVLAARKVFWRLGLFIESLDVGGEKKREVSFNVADGTVLVRSDTEEKRL